MLVVSESDLSHGAFAGRLRDALAEAGAQVALRRVPEPGRLARQLVRPLGTLADAGLQPLRWRLVLSMRARIVLAANAGFAVALVNTQSCALTGTGRVPAVLVVDITGRQFAAQEWWRPRGRLAALNDVPLLALERRALHRAAHVVAWTQTAARSVVEDYGVPPDRVTALHPGLDLRTWPVRARPTRPPGAPLEALFVGNAIERKGLPVLLDALRRTRHPFSLHVVTGDPVAAEPGVTVHRGLAPDSPALRERFATADVLVLPALADAAPWVVVEALATGLPVIGTDVGSIPELVGPGGLIVPPGDAEALARALDELGGDADLRRRLGAAGRASAETRYDRAAATRRLVTLLRRVAR